MFTSATLSSFAALLRRAVTRLRGPKRRQAPALDAPRVKITIFGV